MSKNKSIKEYAKNSSNSRTIKSIGTNERKKWDSWIGKLSFPPGKRGNTKITPARLAVGESAKQSGWKPLAELKGPVPYPDLELKSKQPNRGRVNLEHDRLFSVIRFVPQTCEVAIKHLSALLFLLCSKWIIAPCTNVFEMLGREAGFQGWKKTGSALGGTWKLPW